MWQALLQKSIWENRLFHATAILKDHINVDISKCHSICCRSHQLVIILENHQCTLSHVMPIIETHLHLVTMPAVVTPIYHVHVQPWSRA